MVSLTPTEAVHLPCVRFVLATIEVEADAKAKAELLLFANVYFVKGFPFRVAFFYNRLSYFCIWCKIYFHSIWQWRASPFDQASFQPLYHTLLV
jgi:hypothetical protein